MTGWSIPEGFLPYLMWKGTPQVREETGILVLEGTGHTRETQDLIFAVPTDLSLVPRLPLLARGLIWHEGWDIPTVWAIDSARVCWMDNAHGHSLSQVPAEVLVGNCEKEGQRADIRRILSLPPEQPAWVREALAAGWTPPKGWVDK